MSGIGTKTHDTNAQKALKSEYTVSVEIVADADGLAHFIAPAPGRVRRCILENGAVACSGSVGFEIQLINRSDSDTVLGYFGYGSGTEAAKATDKTAALAAYYTAATGTDHILANTTAERFDANDFLELVVDRDGSTGRGKIIVELSLDGKGR